jgi:hypothetical protein
MQSCQFAVVLEYCASLENSYLDSQITSVKGLIVLPLLGAMSMLQLAVLSTIHVANESRREE